MIRIYQEFDSEEAAIHYRDLVLRSYPPEGYSTHIRIEKVTAIPPLTAPSEGPIKPGELRQRWVAHGSRAESCD